MAGLAGLLKCGSIARFLKKRGAAPAAFLVVLLVLVGSPARADDSFVYSCYTYATLNGYQADRYAAGDWDTSDDIEVTNYTYNANATADDNQCRYNYPYTVEASNYLRPVINGVEQEICDFNYSGIQSTGVTSAWGWCADSVYYDEMFIQMGHRAWLGYGQYRDDYPVKVLCPNGC